MSLASAALLAVIPFTSATHSTVADTRPVVAEPTVSPDGREIAFASAGDIWTVSAAGGDARLLVAHTASESRPLYSPDGSRLAFVSNRTGNGDIYVLGLASGSLTRLTFDDVAETLDGWSRDGKFVYFSSSSRDIAGMNDVLRVRVDGGTPMIVSGDRYASEYWSAPSPTDAGTIAITARGTVSGQWWRKGHSHLDESEIWLTHDAGASPRYERVAGGDAKYAWPMWSTDGRTLYYMSDKSGAENIYAKPVGGAEKAITSFRDGRVLWPSISADGRTIVFERGFRVWKLDPASGKTDEVAIALRGAPSSASAEHLNLSTGFQSLALSPDGKKVAFSVRGEIFATSARDGGEATRVTFDPANDGEVQWAPDSRRLVFTSDRSGATQLYLYDFGTRAETRLTMGNGPANTPIWSPDGKSIAYLQGGRSLRVVDPASKADRVVATGVFDMEPFLSWRGFAWSPDSRWIAYTSAGAKGFANVYLVPAAGGESRLVSFVPNTNNSTVAWSPDATFLLFDSRQRTESGILSRVDLVPRTPRFREDRFRELFDAPARPSAPAPAPATAVPAPRDTGAARPDTARRDSTRAGARRFEPVFEDIRRRLSVVPTGLDIFGVSVSPDGKWALLTASAASQFNLYVYSLDELATEPPVARQITSTAGFKQFAQWTADSKEVYYLEGGRINSVNVESRAVRPVATSAEMDVELAQEKNVMFRQTWNYLNDNFYDPQFHGVNWRAMRDAYAPFVESSRSAEDVRRVLSIMIGELNASHMGITGRSFSPQVVTGRLGVRFDRNVYEREGRFRVSEVIALTPAAVGKIVIGDYLVAVDGVSLNEHSNIDELLTYKIDRRVTLTLANAAGARRDVALRPINTATEKRLLYRGWVEKNRAYVDRVSQGRLGYVHMPDMSEGSLTQLYMDLDPEMHVKSGVVVDLRNNNGGFVNAYALDVLARRPYLGMQPRQFSAATPARTALGQRSLEAPTVLVVNQHSLSDAEDFTEGYRTLKLGPVVGEPTAGWIIYTGNTTLIDGTTLRIPGTRITDAQGKDMELKPRPVDIAVERPIGESYTDRDIQLDAAVKALLGQIRP
jgi:tricorn protease